MKPSKPNFPDLRLFSSVKLGSGVLGKTAPVMMAFFAFMAVVVWKLPASFPYLVFCAGLTGAFILCLYVGISFWYAYRNPGAAVLEGANLVRYRQNEIATNDPAIIDLTANSDANVAPPAQLRGDVEGNHD